MGISFEHNDQMGLQKRYIDITKKVVWTALALVALTGPISSLAAQPICSIVLSRIVESLEQGYLKLSGQGLTPSQKAQKVDDLLNHGFTPFIEKFHDKVMKRTEGEIRAHLNQEIEEAPLRFGPYKPNAQALGAYSDAQGIIEANSIQAYYVYQLEDSPDLIRYTEFVYVSSRNPEPSALGSLYNESRLALTPVGAYGAELAGDMARTTQILIETAASQMLDESKELSLQAGQLLARETARGKGTFDERTGLAYAPVNSLIEGVLSFHQLATMLLATEIPGIESGEEALHAIIEGGSNRLGVASEVTLQVPMGLIGPAILSGYGFKGALKLENGKLIVTEELREFLKQRRAMNERRGRIRRTCPVARFLGTMSEAVKPKDQRVTGIQSIAETYLKVYKAVRAERISKGQAEPILPPVTSRTYQIYQNFMRWLKQDRH